MAWRGAGAAGLGRPACRRARPAGVTGRDRGASGLLGPGRAGQGRGAAGSAGWATAGGALPESAKCAGRRAEAGACAGRRCLLGITARDSCPQTAPCLARPAVPPRRSPLQLPSEGLQPARPATTAPGSSSSRAGPPGGRLPWPGFPPCGPHLPPEAPGGRGRRASAAPAGGALGAGARAFKTLPETLPGGVRPAGPSRRGTPAATLLPARPGRNTDARRPQCPAEPAPAEWEPEARGTGWAVIWGHTDAQEEAVIHPTHSTLALADGGISLWPDAGAGKKRARIEKSSPRTRGTASHCHHPGDAPEVRAKLVLSLIQDEGGHASSVTADMTEALENCRHLKLGL